VRCIDHCGHLGVRNAVEKGGKEMRPLQTAKVVTRNVRNAFNYPARQAVLREQQVALSLPLHKPVESGKTRFLTSGDAAVRMLEQLSAVITALQRLVHDAPDAKVCCFVVCL
jgi:hypothetical protein